MLADDTYQNRNQVTEFYMNSLQIPQKEDLQCYVRLVLERSAEACEDFLQLKGQKYIFLQGLPDRY